ncbi:hypothetical protein QAD02_014740 [Eretmocerus hayati]|uniref:Uncharacterized protein n=1 Tax=Eretmocerus hayati TaxID=131215 RepID=A0ACC2P652_9HYME|nr:hypothetical protein QAD02_014740 [Eretmocerus hayati]
MLEEDDQDIEFIAGDIQPEIDLLEAPEVPEKEPYPVFRHYEEVPQSGLGNMCQEIMSALHSRHAGCSMSTVTSLDLSIGRFGLNSTSSSRLGSNSSRPANCRELMDATRRKLRGEMEDDQEEMMNIIGRVEARVKADVEEGQDERVEMEDDQEEMMDMMDRVKAQVGAGVEEGQDDRVELIHGLEDQLNAMDQRLRNNHALLNLETIPTRTAESKLSHNF